MTRSVLFRESDIGRHKATVVAERVKELNPDVQVHQIIGKLELAFGRGLLSEMDVVIGCLDSVGARRMLNHRCYFAGVPWIDGGISHLSGNVALFNPRVPETACYRCKMNTSAWERLNEKYSCGYLKDNYQEPTLTTTIMTASVIAAYQVEVAVQLLLGDSNFQSGTQLILPVRNPIGFRTIEFSLDKECPDHRLIPENPEILPQRLFSLEHTPRQVASELGLVNDWKLELPFDLISKFICNNCGFIEVVRKPKQEIKQSQAKCPDCGNPKREATEYFQVTNNSEEADLPFSSFGLCTRELVFFIQGEKRVLIELSTTEGITVTVRSLTG